MPAADKPANYDVLGYVKMEASAVNGTADAYFDDYSLSAASPQCPAAEFAYRNSLIDSGQFNTSTFKLFPAREMGQNNHSNQFNFDIQNANQYKDTYNDTTVPQNDGTLCASSNRAGCRRGSSAISAPTTSRTSRRAAIRCRTTIPASPTRRLT